MKSLEKEMEKRERERQREKKIKIFIFHIFQKYLNGGGRKKT